MLRGYRYVKARDSIDPAPRPENEIKQRYARLIACIAPAHLARDIRRNAQ
jgi:restriction system protein